MILPDYTIQELKAKSGLTMEPVKDYDVLALCIFEATKRRIGATTLKRLFGRFEDDRATSAFTLNTIALYLGYDSWDAYLSVSMRSEEDFDDDAIYISQLPTGQKARVSYLNRVVDFIVTAPHGVNVLQVLSAENSSLHQGDQLHICRLKVGEILEAPTLVRSGRMGNYRTRGKLQEIELL